jgi:hypothetical protein
VKRAKRKVPESQEGKALKLAWERMLPDSPDKARHRLMELGDSLYKNNFYWPSTALLVYLAGFTRTLDQVEGEIGFDRMKHGLEMVGLTAELLLDGDVVIIKEKNPLDD